MFIEPIKRTTLTSLEEVKDFSYQTYQKSEKHLTYWMNNGQYAFTDDLGYVYVTPYRPEISDILTSNGYTEKNLYVPFSNGIDEIPVAYQWLQKMSRRQCKAATEEAAHQIALLKKLQEVNLDVKGIHVTEVCGYLADKEGLISYSSMVYYIDQETRKNIGTYIIINEKTLVICDEYGRTFLVKVPKVINTLVNSLIDAGYTETPHPESYVFISPKKEEE